MGFFGSGDKVSTSADNRVGASDDAIVIQSGGFLFAPASKQPNATIGSSEGKPNWNVIVIVAGAVFALVIFLKLRE